MKHDTTEYSRQVLADVKRMQSEELFNLHGIRINQDNTVYDEAYDKTFKNIGEWISFASNDSDNEFEKFGTTSEEYY